MTIFREFFIAPPWMGRLDSFQGEAYATESQEKNQQLYSMFSVSFLVIARRSVTLFD